jgi:uncharacterized protein
MAGLARSASLTRRIPRQRSAASPGLAAQFLDCGGFSNAYRSGIRHGGAFDLKQATWAYNNALADAKDPAVKAALEAEDIRAWFTRMPWRIGQSPVSAAPDYGNYLFEQWSHGIFDDFWKRLGIYAEGYYERYADVPIVHLSGWYDPYARTATENYLGLKREKRALMRLILGPWTHGDRSLSYAGEVDFGPTAPVDGNLAEDFFALRLAWYDRWLKNGSPDAGPNPTVQVFVMGGGLGRLNPAGRFDHGGRWRTATDWPLPETRWTQFYLQPDRSLARTLPPQGARPLAYAVDPRHPVPTIGGALSSGEPVMRAGAYDQRTGPNVFGASEPYRPLAERPDVLVFATPPLDGALEVTGSVTARLWIASDCPDTDFTAKLIDVYPPNQDYPKGFAMNLTEGILRVRFHDSWERPSPMVPGEIYAITIKLFPTSNLFARATGCASTFRAATFRISTSTRIRAGSKARWSTRASLEIGFLPTRCTRLTSSFRLFRKRLSKLRQRRGDDSLRAKRGCEVRDAEWGVVAGGCDRRRCRSGRDGSRVW